jgi:hypothetical protein
MAKGILIHGGNAMRKFLPATMLLIALTAMLAWPALAEEEAGAPEAGTTRTKVKIITPGAAEESCDDEDLPALEPGHKVIKEQVIIPLVGMAIPIIFMLGVVAVVVVAILVAQRAARMRYDVIQLAIKEGRDLPPELFRNGFRRRQRDPLLGGLVLTALGISLSISLGAVSGWVQAVWGLIPLLVGVALLVYVPFWRKKKKEEEE